MKVWVLYKEEELDFNQYFLQDVELFDNEEPAQQAAFWLNERLDNYDRQYNGWSVEERLVRMRDMESPQQESQKGVS